MNTRSARNRVIRRIRRGLLACTGAAVLAVGACETVEAPVGPDLADDPVAAPKVRNASFIADVDLVDGTINITAPEEGVDQNLIGDYFGLEPGAPELSILGGDVIDVEPDEATLSFGPPQPSLRRNVSYEITVRNRLAGVALAGTTTFPLPPTGVTSPTLFAFENVVTQVSGTVTQGGETNDIIVETPNEGDVLTTDTADWVGPHNFFNDDGCPLGANLDGLSSDSDCFLYQPIVAAGTGADQIDGLGSSEPIRVSFDPELTVNNFRTRFIVAANLVDATPNALPTASFSFGTCDVGQPVTFDGSGSSDSDGFLEDYAWDFGDGSSTSGSSSSATNTYAAAGTYSVSLTVRDNRGGTDTQTQSISCTEPPPNAAVAKELQSTSGAPVASVEQGQSYQYEVTVTNTGSISTVTGLALTDQLDADIDFASATVSVTGGTNPTGSVDAAGLVTVPASGTMDIAPGGTVSIVIGFTVDAGTAGGTLDNTATLSTVGNDSNAGDNSASVLGTPIASAPNLLVRWVALDGTPITSATVGDQIRAHVCALEGTLENFQASLDFNTTELTYSDALDLDSDGQGSFGANPANAQPHPDCAGIAGEVNFDDTFGTSDLLDDQFQKNDVSGTGAGPVNFLNQRTELTAENVEPVGILDIIFTVQAAGTVDAADLTWTFQIFNGTGGVPITPALDIAPLQIN